MRRPTQGDDSRPEALPPSPRPPETRPSRTRRLARHFPHLLGLLLLAGAVFVVQREFRHLSLAQVRHGLGMIPRHALFASAGCTLLSYLVLSFYDRLAVIHLGHRLSFGRTCFAAFCSYVLSHNLGFSALSGAAVRFRLYGNWGLAPAEIAKIVAFCSVTFALGACALTGGVLLIAPATVPELGDRLPLLLLRLAGLAAWGVVLCYVVLAARVPAIRLGRWRIEMPGAAMAVGQVVVASLDVAATAAIAYCLLPAGTGLSYPGFLAIYIASYTAGLLAGVPGGLGVFDGAMLLGLSDWLPPDRTLGVIFVFRIFYYIVPLFLAGILFAGHELLLRGDRILRQLPVPGPLSGRSARPGPRPSLVIRQSEADFSVAVAVGAVALCGAMLLALGVLDPDADLAVPLGASPFDRPSGVALWLTSLAGDYVPSLIGAALMGLAIGLSNRVTLAWGASIVLLCAGSALTALHGNSLAVSGTLALAALLMAPFRSSYYRHARILCEPFAPGTALPLLLLVVCVLTLGAMEPHMRNIAANSWWSVVLTDGATNRTRAALGCAVLIMLVALWRLLSPGRIVPLSWEAEGRGRYNALAAEARGPVAGAFSRAAGARLAPRAVVTTETGRAAIAFTRLAMPGARHGGGLLLVALGDPVGAAAEQVSAIWRLRDLALQEGRDPVFCNVGPGLLHLYEDLGLTVWPLSPDRFLCCDAGQVQPVRQALGL